ncbi:hypothetical protein SY85_11680 [Flavisolibacter tropicus]|uniref:Alpha glucuronidase N-terminal domain-containing protein n=1 Tax=Flavisolibacter tropicus TaxID=1492898 RepID=A0A172U2D3_9BACT|nr:hypothetical protein SY85_11680 [Flavisolibacter tropicus]
MPVVKVAPSINLSAASLVLAPGMSKQERKAAEMLLEEVEKRSMVRWPIEDQLAKEGKTSVVLGRRSELIRAYPELANSLTTNNADKPEGYQIVCTKQNQIIVAGNDARGVLYGAGRLLRLLNYSPATVSLNANTAINTAPQYPLRGHQLGYRPKTNSYDAWDVKMWEQYIRDLVIFGANAIELIPPVSDDDSTSPHFPLPQIKMMAEMSRIAADYGIECWVWYPALEKSYADPATVQKAVKEWGDVLRQLPRVDAVFVPGGDPGHTPPKDLFPMLEKQTAQLQKLHPGAKMWMSPQGFTADWMNDFYQLMKAEPIWLEGIVFGPQQRESIQDLSAKLPKRYKLRFYPDITHTIRAQYPVPDWDFAYRYTLNREPINPRPIDEANIFRKLQPIMAHGFLTYSEGCNDDVNKFVWSGLGWDASADITSILTDYSRYFIGADKADAFAQGLLSLEQNWRGPLAVNQTVQTTLLQFQDMERTATPSQLLNWRFQQAMYRAYYDASLRSRLITEMAQEEKAMEILRKAPLLGSVSAIEAAKQALDRNNCSPSIFRGRAFELAEALYQSIRMQLSVSKYKAIAIGRGANLDLIDFPLTNAPWLNSRLAEVEKLSTEADRLRMINDILNYNNPGAGGFYDDLGNPYAQPHLVKGTSYDDDPAYLQAPMSGFTVRFQDNTARVSAATFAESLHDRPLEMLYTNLNKNAQYRLRIVYGAEAKSDIQLMANGSYTVHPMRAKEMNLQPVEFDLPTSLTENGQLRLSWTRPAGLGGSGRGAQVSEVWLIPVTEAPASATKPL